MMRRKISIALLFILSAAVPLTLYAENPKAVLTYCDNINQVTVYDFSGNIIHSIDIGSALLIGYSIETGRSTAELEMTPNGSILKVSENSFVKIEDLQGTQNSRTHRLALGKGRLRMIAAKLFGSRYMVTTPSTVLGVRGTDFVISVENKRESELLVREGLVETYPVNSGAIDLFGPGQGAELNSWRASAIDSERQQVLRQIEDFQFSSRSPDQVPRQAARDDYIAYNYYRDIDRKAFRTFFEEEKYFADYKTYIERFESYYRDEIADFEEKYAEELKEFGEYTSREMDEFEQFKNRQNRW